MALPSSGQLSFSAIRTEFTNGGCLEVGSDYSLSAFAAAIGYVNPSIATSAFYGGECPPSLICYCYNLVLEALATDYEYTDCCGSRVTGNTSQGITRCCDSSEPPFASSGTWTQLGPCECGDECRK
jgi:hypothetical protein